LAIDLVAAAAGVSKAPITFIKVDLPEPEGPMIASSSPFCTTRSTLRRAWIRSAPSS
jgi:hypothetical protein